MKKRSLPRAAAFAAALIIAAGAAAACGTPGQPDSTSAAGRYTEDPAAQTTAPLYDKDGFLLDDIDSGIDFGDAEVRVLYWSDRENQEYFSEGENGSEVNDAIFSRNSAVEDRLRVKFDFVPTPGNSSKASEFLAGMQNNVKSGDPGYDIISAHSRSIGLCAYNGLTQDLMQYPVINTSKPWWPSSLTEKAVINGRLHFVSGDISTNMLYMMYVVFYNRSMAEDLRLTDPLTLVPDGNWTLEKMIGLSAGIYQDADNDGKKSTGDIYGQATRTLHCDAYFFGSDISAIDKEGGRLVLSEQFTGEKMGALIDSLRDYFGSSDALLQNDYKGIFREGRSLFVTDRADIAISDLDGKTFELGILPVPKFDANQERYLTAVGNPFSLYSIPVNAADPEMSATVIECMASESYRKVTPSVFDVTMKARYAERGEDAAVYDTVRAGAVYDLSRIFWKVFDSSGKAPDTIFQSALTSTTGWSSLVKSELKVLKKTVEGINTAFAG